VGEKKEDLMATKKPMAEPAWSEVKAPLSLRPGGIGGTARCVMDASVFPVVPCADTNFPTLMTAEKIAATMMAE
jgi:hypothetical protein